MTSFKRAAIEILKDAKEPLNCIEITKRALDRNLIETSGKTPEATMEAQIAMDIKAHADNSPFVRVKPGIFALNPNHKEEEEEAIEEEILIENEQISTQYTGKAGEHLVVSELLFRGYNASIMNVDEGLDIVATKDDKLFNVQVKTSNENRFNRYVSGIRVSSFEKHNTSNTFYIFILRSKDDTRFLIFPYHEMQKFIDQKIILLIDKNTRYRVNISLRDGKIYLGNQNNEVSYNLGKWDMIK
jgi:Holliday junction resolvase-like predicted endonuclease